MQALNTPKTKKIYFSNHALLRMQQRGIKERTFSLLKDYGHFTYSRGAVVLSLNKTEKSYIRSDLSKQAFKKVEKELNSYFVISQNGTIITAAKAYKKVRRH